jgi:hypothetical protein
MEIKILNFMKFRYLGGQKKIRPEKSMEDGANQ